MEVFDELQPSLEVLQGKEWNRSILGGSRDWITLQIILGDFLVLVLVLSTAVLTRQEFDFGIGKKGFIPSDYLSFVLVGSVLYLILLELNGGFRKNLFLNKIAMLRAILKTTPMWTAAVLIATRAFDVHNTVSRLFVLVAFIYLLVFMVGWRLMLRKLLCMTKQTALLKDRVLVVGWSKETEVLSQQIGEDEAHPYEVIGCTPSAHAKFWVHPPKGVPVLGDYNSIETLLQEHQPDILIMADLDPVMGEIVALAQLCVKEHVKFKVIPSFFQIFVSGLHLESISGVPIMGISKLPLDHNFNRLLKRFFDIVGALVGLVVAIPLTVIFGFLIHRESPGPIFYTQTRSGRNGRTFQIYKLRSMRLKAETNGPQWTVENDPRRLKIGEFMRRYNIDEVPQFLNVLTGDMSLVGPRPERPELIQNFKEEINHYNARHIAKPGITGYAQIHGLRGNTDLKERVRYDLYYLENWSLWLDCFIMVKTFFVRQNAY